MVALYNLYGFGNQSVRTSRKVADASADNSSAATESGADVLAAQCIE
jgi:hypothetical protein